MSRKPFAVGLRIFASKAQAKKYAQEVLHMGPPFSTLDEEFLLMLFSKHQSAAEKFGAGVSAIRTGNARPYNTTCFVLDRIDGTSTDISYLECFTPSTSREWFRTSCRRAVQDQLSVALRGAPEFCPITGDPLNGDIHVDHAPPWTFEAIVVAFINELGLDVASVKYTDGDGIAGTEFADSSLSDSFADFHRRYAVLRAVSRRANLSVLRKGSR